MQRQGEDRPYPEQARTGLGDDRCGPKADDVALERRDDFGRVDGGEVAGAVYWRHSTEGQAERRLFEQLDRGEKLSALDVARDRFMWGSPEEIVSEIGEYVRLGPTEFSVSFTGGMTTHR